MARTWKLFHRFRFSLLAATGCFVLYYGLFELDFAQARWLQSYGGYFLCLLSVCFAGAFLWIDRKTIFDIRTHTAERGSPLLIPLLTTLLASYFVFLHEPFALRVFNDEPSHLSTARAMAEDRGTYSPATGFYESGGYSYGNIEPVYRMYLYPFFVSVLHNLTGERIANGFIVNVAAIIALFFIVFWLGRQFGGGDLFGYAAQALLITSPLLAHVANSAAYDPLNLALLALFALTCLHYSKQPGLMEGMNSCLATGILLSYARSESILYLVVFVLIFCWKCWRERRVEVTWFAVFSPLLLLGPFAGRILAQAYGSTFKLIYDTETAGFFGLEHILPNALAVWNWSFSLQNANLNDALLAYLLFAFVGAGLLGFLLQGLRSRTQKERGHLPAGGVAPGERVRSEPERGWILLSFWLVVLIHLGIFFAHFWSPIEISAVRFFLPFTLFSILAVIWLGAYLTRSFLPHALRAMPIFLTVLAVTFFWTVTLPKAARAEMTHRSANSVYARDAAEWARAHDDGKTLFVGRMVDLLSLHEIPVVGTRFFHENYDKIDGLVAAGLYERVLSIDFEHYNPERNAWDRPIPRIPERPEIVFETLFSHRGFIHAEQSYRRVVGWRKPDGSILPLGEKTEKPAFEDERALVDHLRELRGAKRP